MPKLTPRERELLTSLIACREACCAAMRVIADIDMGNLLGIPEDTKFERFVSECALIGVPNGFGAKADTLIKSLRES